MYLNYKRIKDPVFEYGECSSSISWKKRHLRLKLLSHQVRVAQTINLALKFWGSLIAYTFCCYRQWLLNISTQSKRAYGIKCIWISIILGTKVQFINKPFIIYLSVCKSIPWAAHTNVLCSSRSVYIYIYRSIYSYVNILISIVTTCRHF